MTLSVSSVLHYWSSRYGPLPIVGGAPTHSRNSAGSWIDQQGRLNSQIVNTPRQQWASVSSERRQVLTLEAGETNYWLGSEALSGNGNITTSHCSFTASATTAPNGATNGTKLVEDNTNNAHRFSEPIAALGNGQAFTLSVFAKSAERNNITLTTLCSDGSTEHNAIFDLNAGTVTGSNATRSGIIPLGGGWYRCWMSDTNAAGGSAAVARVWLGSAAPYLGDGSSGAYVFGVQFEIGLTPTAYILTTSATVSRSADQFSWSHTAAPQPMMIYARFIERGNALLGNRLLQIGKSDNSAACFIIGANGSAHYFAQYVNGSTQTATLAAGPNYGDTVELVAVLDTGQAPSIYQSINGAAATSAGPGTGQALTSAWSDVVLWLNSIGSSAVGINDFAEIKIVKYGDVVASTAAGRLAELAAFELSAAGAQL